MSYVSVTPANKAEAKGKKGKRGGSGKSNDGRGSVSSHSLFYSLNFVLPPLSSSSGS